MPNRSYNLHIIFGTNVLPKKYDVSKPDQPIEGTRSGHLGNSAAGLGLEPRITDPESAVIPFHHPAMLTSVS